MALLLYGGILRRIVEYFIVRPRLDFWYVKHIYGHSSLLSELRVANTRLYWLVSRLVSLSYPYKKDEFDTWWIFYLPLRRMRFGVFREAVVVPVHILRYRDKYFLLMQSIGCVEIAKENDPDVVDMERSGISYIRSGEIVDATEEVVREMYRFLAFIMADPRIVKRLVPYDVRTGKIRGKCVLESTIPRKVEDSIFEEIS